MVKKFSIFWNIISYSVQGRRINEFKKKQNVAGRKQVEVVGDMTSTHYTVLYPRRYNSSLADLVILRMGRTRSSSQIS
jgi:hypothetical protein